MNKKACRVCFKTNSEVYNLFQMTAIDLDGNEIPLRDMLNFCCSVEVDINLPRDICTNCANACTNSYNFIKQFRKSNDILVSSLKNYSNPVQTLVSVKNEDEMGNNEKLSSIDGNSAQYSDINLNCEVSEEFIENMIECRANEPIILQTVTVVEDKSSNAEKPRKTVRKRKYPARNRAEMCTYCGKIYKGCLKYHEEIHKNELKYECEICHEKFIAKDKIKYHRIKVHNIGSYLCPDCGQVFHNKTQLRNHTWIHTGIKSYQCENCQQQFTSPNSLKKHRLKNLCGKRKVYRASQRPEDILLQENS